ncbi:hypothetical protein BDZ91DRAFT_785162 [Kalaharituber pfeilii]|nr:hypothetical protein BDZ91DRAFT_785162 [Kalaharituber pfeilii]
MASTSATLDTYSLTDISPAAYLTFTKFTFPTANGGKMAVAMSQKDARIIGALYILLITVVFKFTWDILLSISFLMFATKRMNRTDHITMIAAWNAADPLHALPVLAQHALTVLWGILKSVNSIEMTWKTLGLDAVIMFFALGAWGGSFATGLRFPELLVLGNAAPVNPKLVFFPDFNRTNAISSTNLVNMQYNSRLALRSIASVEGYEKKIGAHVNVTISDMDNNFNDTGEKRYRIHYRYTVRGLDMGLQHLSQLVLHVEGQCNFENSWYAGSQNSTLPNGENMKYRKNLLYNHPSTAKRMSYTNGTDAWYATQLNPTEALRTKYNYTYEVKTARPPLKCEENNRWSYKDWQGTIADFLTKTNNAPPVTIPQAIKEILATQLIIPVVLNLGRSNIAGSLKSASRSVSPDNALYAQNESAKDDITRLVYAAFIGTRDIFRNAAITAAALDNPDIHNVLRFENGSYMQGTGDFILVSREVVALSLVQITALPAALGVILLISIVLKIARKLTVLGTGRQGRFKRFVMYTAGLQATQLYRMLDETLAKQKNLAQQENLEHQENLAQQDNTPVWTHHRGWVPVVASETEGIPVAELQADEFSGISMRRRNEQISEIATSDTSYPSKSTPP